jgi:hypothetical protein
MPLQIKTTVSLAVRRAAIARLYARRARRFLREFFARAIAAFRLSESVARWL